VNVDAETAAGAALICALGHLTEKQRRVFVLHELHGQTLAEIADQLGITRSATWLLYGKAQRHLADELEPWREALAA
jgi:DNA-directed RNA polymerase specialized sigma24 family protein